MANSNEFYPEGCDRDGGDCTDCVTRTADALVAISSEVSPDGAARAFRSMYQHPACRLMEHTFVWSCCRQKLEYAA